MDPALEAEDTALVQRAQKGDDAAFGKLVQRYQRRLHAMALGMLKDSDEARDVVQDAFLKAYRHLASYEGQAKFYTWLYRIALNLCIDRSRRANRHGKVEFDEVVDREEMGDSGISPRRLGFDPARALSDREIRERLNEAIAQLSPIHRAVLLSREVDGLSYREIADVMECSEGTVMSRLFHARKRMQEMLRPIVQDGEVSPASAPAIAAPGEGSPPQQGKVTR